MKSKRLPNDHRHVLRSILADLEQAQRQRDALEGVDCVDRENGTVVGSLDEAADKLSYFLSAH